MSATIWVTGVGLVTSLGTGVERTWERLCRGETGFRSIRGLDVTGQRACLAGEVDGVAAERPAGSRSSAMAALAAAEAMQRAGLDAARARVGLVVGGTTGGMLETEHLLARLHAEPDCQEALAGLLSHPLSATAERLDEQLGPFSRVRAVSSACSSGLSALVVAAAWLAEGDLDAVVAGASDALCLLTLSGFNALGAVDPGPCRPFDRRRSGITLGEGAGFVVLERAAGARARRATPVAELAGWALGAEAHHITNPAPDGAVVEALVRRALARAGISPSGLDFVCAHGTGTVLGDPVEAAALARSLGPEAARIQVASSKGQLGHTLAAAGAIDAALTALVVERGVLLATGGLEEVDPAIALPGLGAPVRQARVRAAACCALGFGGMDAVVVLSGPGGRPARPSAPPQDVVVTGAAIAAARGLAGIEQCARLEETPGEGPLDLDRYLDPVRARRLDRAARLGVVAAQHALAGAGGPDEATGVVLGSAFGQVDAAAAFVHRILERGPRSAPPADFPNLVPSALAGHASIYLGLRGPAFTVSDLATSGLAAIAQAAQLLGAGECERLVAGAVEPRGDIVERALAALFAESTADRSRRDDLAAAVVLESAAAAARRGARPLARVARVVEWRGGEGDGRRDLGPAGADEEVVLARTTPRTTAWLEAAGWGAARRHDCARMLGDSEGLGAAAMAVGACRIATGRATRVLVLAMGRRAAGFVLLTAP